MSTKRQVLTVLICAGLVGAGACASGSSGGPAAGGGRDLTTTTPPGTGEVDRVTWALPYGEPTTLDPAKVGDYSPQTVESNLCDTLLRVNADMTIGPGLAQKAEWSDERTLVLDLRPDVRFWDGTPMRPEDVVHSLDRQRDPATQGLYGSFLSAVTAIDVTGPHQVTLRTRTHDQSLRKALATSFGAVNQEAFTRKAGAAYGTPSGGLMCTGPYKLASWKSGDSVTVDRNDGYWDPQLKPKVGQVVFRFITNGNTLTSALLSGEVDGTYELPPSGAAALAKASNGTTYLGPATQNVLIVPGSATSPAADRRLLDALSLAVDRDALIKNVFGGDATVLKSLVPPATWAGDPARADLDAAYAALPGVAEPDLDRARQLVGEMGAAVRPLVAAIPSGDQKGLQILTFLQAAAKEVGVEIRIRQLQPTEMSSLFYDPAIREGVDLVLTFGYVSAPDPAAYVSEMVTPGGMFNWTRYDNPAVTRLIEQARSTPDPVASAKAYIDAQALFTPTVPVVFLAAPHERMFMNKRISGAPASFAYMGMPWAAYLGGTSR